MGSDGITLTNKNGYTSKFYVKDDETALEMEDDLYIGKGVHAHGISYFDTNVMFNGTLYIGNKTLASYIDSRIAAAK